MTVMEKMRTITAVKVMPPARLVVAWSDGIHADLDLSAALGERAFKPLADPSQFAQAKVGEWGHAVEWPCGVEMGADALWLETLSATGRQETRRFLEWRLRHGLSLSATAEALGLSRRMVAYYSSGEKPVPRAILLACKGWEVSDAAA